MLGQRIKKVWNETEGNILGHDASSKRNFYTVVSRFLKKNNPYFLRICDGDQYQTNIKGFFCLQHCMTKRFLSSASIQK